VAVGERVVVGRRTLGREIRVVALGRVRAGVAIFGEDDAPSSATALGLDPPGARFVLPDLEVEVERAQLRLVVDVGLVARCGVADVDGPVVAARRGQGGARGAQQGRGYEERKSGARDAPGGALSRNQRHVSHNTNPPGSDSTRLAQSAGLPIPATVGIVAALAGVV